MTDKYPGVYRGPTGAEAIVDNYTANGAILVGAVVTWTTSITTGEETPRVQQGTSATAPQAGIVVDGDNRGTYGGVDGSVTNPSSAASAAGQGVQVCILGRAKIIVDGSTGSIAIGDPIAASTVTAGYGAKAATGASNYVIARALQASTAYGDIIQCDIRPEGRYP